MNPVEHARHLARRFAGMLSNAPVGDADIAWVESNLSSTELQLWHRMTVADRRHSVEVARRFAALEPTASRTAVSAALLHDIGKLDSGLGVGMRVIATIVGPRTDRLRRYHDHERIGASMLRAVGSDERTVALVGGTSADTATAASLQAADDI